VYSLGAVLSNMAASLTLLYSMPSVGTLKPVDYRGLRPRAFSRIVITLTNGML
jgi:hypothetical protein